MILNKHSIDLNWLCFLLSPVINCCLYITSLPVPHFWLGRVWVCRPHAHEKASLCDTDKQNHDWISHLHGLWPNVIIRLHHKNNSIVRTFYFMLSIWFWLPLVTKGCVLYPFAGQALQFGQRREWHCSVPTNAISPIAVPLQTQTS